MGILGGPVAWIRKLKLPKGFEVCEFGDQWLTQTGGAHRIAEEFYLEELRCGRYVSIDGNGRGTITHDLNLALPPDLGTFDLVTDFGTGEHIFNQHRVWWSLNALCRVGGYIAFDRPSQGYPGHCYYRTDECLFHDIAAANDYEIVRFEAGKVMSRGELIRGIFRKTVKAKFRVPQQGRYRKILKI